MGNTTALTEADVPVTLGPPTLLDPGVSAAGRAGGLDRPPAPSFESSDWPLRRLARTGIGRAGRTRAGRRLLEAALKDDENVAWLLHWLCNWICARAEFDEAFPSGLRRVRGFEDLVWLYSTNALNQRLSRLGLDEAAHLYRLVNGLDSPRVAEIGRYKGGTTLLLAAAGARVTSLDVDAARQEAFAPPLERTLARLGLSDRVDLVVADSRTYAVEDASYDVVFLDGDYSAEGLRADWARWWPAVVPSGHLILHLVSPGDLRWPVLAPAFAPGWRVADELAARPDAAVADAPPSLAHFVKRQ